MSKLWVRQAITTRYHGPTNTRGARISARAHAGRIIISYDHSLDGLDNHARAAHAFAQKMGWRGTYIGGAPHGEEYVWVHHEPEAELVVA